ncbi:hypothetical protein CROQUDRAFT_85480 [Cronartium quercuum f. sp. fusiforme G11]|uniref:Uncharacterized protein n=1 Tax=Cronartium quercuum f. sp. fusiforme G11 TaxID=708437 RepID=A0A9P6NUB4_9BASI|nr:hypothetical protein CROQUDRAFT_85480 [Cronartium quercuum f. sp. fusiforme G11]
METNQWLASGPGLTTPRNLAYITPGPTRGFRHGGASRAHATVFPAVSMCCLDQ